MATLFRTIDKTFLFLFGKGNTQSFLTSLFLGDDGDGLSLGVVEAVHGADVHHHHYSEERDRKEDEHHKEAGPDCYGEETLTVQGVSEVSLVFRGVGLDLERRLETLDLSFYEREGLVRVLDMARISEYLCIKIVSS